MLFKLSFDIMPLNFHSADMDEALRSLSGAEHTVAGADAASMLPAHHDAIASSVHPSTESVELNHATTPVELSHGTTPVQLASSTPKPTLRSIHLTPGELKRMVESRATEMAEAINDKRRIAMDRLHAEAQAATDLANAVTMKTNKPPMNLPSIFSYTEPIVERTSEFINPQGLDAETIGKRALGVLAGLGVAGGALVVGGHRIFERPLIDDLATGAMNMGDKAGELASVAGSKTKSALEEAFDYIKGKFSSFTGGEKTPTTRANIPRAKVPPRGQTIMAQTPKASAAKEVESKSMTKSQTPVDKMKRQHIRQDVEKEEELGE